MEKYTKLKKGDRIVVFTYTNTSPRSSGIVMNYTEHFVEIKNDHFLGATEWISRVNVEVVK